MLFAEFAFSKLHGPEDQGRVKIKPRATTTKAVKI